MPKPVEKDIREMLIDACGYHPAFVEALDHESLMELGYVELVAVLKP